MSLRIAIALVSLTAFVGCGAPAGSDSQPVESGVELVSFNPDSLPTVEIEVPAIHCEACASGVTKCLKNEPGVKDIVVDVETKTATLAVDESLFDADKAVVALTDAQFPESAVVKANADQALGTESPREESGK